MKDDVLKHHLKFSIYTDPGLYKDYLIKKLPNNIKEIGQLVRKQIIHRITLKDGNTGSNTDLRYGDMTKVPWYQQCQDDVLSTTSAILNFQKPLLIINPGNEFPRAFCKPISHPAVADRRLKRPCQFRHPVLRKKEDRKFQ